MPARPQPSDRAAVVARAPARAGLMGNPGDVYGGKAIAVALWNFSARVRIEPAAELALPDDSGAAALLSAALGRLPEAPHRRLALALDSDVPRQVGLAGSSAIVVAALKALCSWFGIALHPAELAERALAAEAQDLGIVAGPMDRVIQAYGGLLHMDFAPPRGAHSYRRLDPSLLPPMFVAWDPLPGQMSGVPHADVRARWERGDPAVREAVAEFPRLVDEALACLECGDREGFLGCVDRNFDTRASIWPCRARDLEMVRVGRGCGAAVKFAGSGGAVVGFLRGESRRPDVENAYAEAGFRCLRPQLDPSVEDAA
jgi:glucuronokinase